MREVLYRGIRSSDRHWVYGYYVKEKGKHYIYDNEVEAVKWEVIPETVGQYIGTVFHFYEGDIISDNVGIGVIEYYEKHACFKVRYRHKEGLCKHFCDYLDSELLCVEKIGNKTDNPELINNKTLKEE